jgi:hypothetical protein
MAPALREDYLKLRNEIDSTGKGFVPVEGFKGSMAFEKRFVEAGGLLAAGVDPTGMGGALAGYGDQRNYELLVEAGFTPAQTIQIMTLNGARILGVDKQLGTVEKGKLADLVVLQGDLTQDPTVIRNTTTVFKDGIGYDSAPLDRAARTRAADPRCREAIPELPAASVASAYCAVVSLPARSVSAITWVESTPSVDSPGWISLAPDFVVWFAFAESDTADNDVSRGMAL